MRGKELNFTVNGEKRTVKGKLGEAAEILLNGQPAGINASIEQKDKVKITDGVMNLILEDDPMEEGGQYDNLSRIFRIKKPEKKAEKIIMDLEDREDRIAKLTRFSGRLGDHYMTKDGKKLYYIVRLEKSMDLCCLDL